MGFFTNGTNGAKGEPSIRCERAGAGAAQLCAQPPRWPGVLLQRSAAARLLGAAQHVGAGARPGGGPLALRAQPLPAPCAGL
jgi:hypothetical protein